MLGKPINRATTSLQPYTTTRTWGELPPGVKWAAVTAIEPAPDGTIYVVHRCFENSCAGRTEAPILKYNAEGKLLAAFGQGVLIFPHGGTVDRDGNLWITDAGSAPGKGHQVFKFSPDGKVLMTLGKAGVSGSGPDLFDQPTDVVVAPNGDLFVTDSHRNGKNNRVMHFTRQGKFIKEWGRKGTGRGELSEPHTMAMDSRGRLFVGDRENNRIVIYSQDGQVLDEWRQFGRPSGIAITADDTIYVADSESWGRHRRPRAARHQEGHSHRQRARRPRHRVHRGPGIDGRRSRRRRRRRRRCAGERLRRRRSPPHARTARQEIRKFPRVPKLEPLRYDALGMRPFRATISMTPTSIACTSAISCLSGAIVRRYSRISGRSTASSWINILPDCNSTCGCAGVETVAGVARRRRDGDEGPQGIRIHSFS